MVVDTFTGMNVGTIADTFMFEHEVGIGGKEE